MGVVSRRSLLTIQRSQFTRERPSHRRPSRRGYAADNPHERISDISAAYPRHATVYGFAKTLSLRHRRGQVQPGLKESFRSSRALFDEILGGQDEELKRAPHRSTTRRRGHLAGGTTKQPCRPPKCILCPNVKRRTCRKRWKVIQASFVDEPRKTVQKTDQLVKSAVRRSRNYFEASDHRWSSSGRVEKMFPRRTCACRFSDTGRSSNASSRSKTPQHGV